LPTPAHRRSGWTILVVPPRPDRKTRAFRLRRRHLKIAGGILGSILLACGGFLAVSSIVHVETEAQLADAQSMILMLTDSLQQLQRDAASAALDAASAAASPKISQSLARRRTTKPRPRSEYGASQPAPGVVLPVIGRISSRFARSRIHPLLHIFRPHYGVDLAAPAGTNINAPAAGRVKYAGRKVGYGLIVELDHGDGVVSSYSHCKSVNVKAGDVVAAGDVIATVGKSGLATAPHVHFEVRVRGKPVDPLKYILAPQEPQVATPELPTGIQEAPAAPAIMAPQLPR
jgi:murein DD-endopeptidase MepM/ murein hydrolase activator NlpD